MSINAKRIDLLEDLVIDYGFRKQDDSATAAFAQALLEEWGASTAGASKKGKLFSLAACALGRLKAIEAEQRGLSLRPSLPKTKTVLWQTVLSAWEVTDYDDGPELARRLRSAYLCGSEEVDAFEKLLRTVFEKQLSAARLYQLISVDMGDTVDAEYTLRAAFKALGRKADSDSLAFLGAMAFPLGRPQDERELKLVGRIITAKEIRALSADAQRALALAEWLEKKNLWQYHRADLELCGPSTAALTWKCAYGGPAGEDIKNYFDGIRELVRKGMTECGFKNFTIRLRLKIRCDDTDHNSEMTEEIRVE